MTEKEQKVLEVYNNLSEPEDSIFGHACKYCMACTGNFPDGESYQSVYNKMVEKGIIKRKDNL
jgi:hypothetical protein